MRNELEGRGQLEEVGGAAYITQLINAVPSAIHVEAYGRLVEQAAVRRRLIGVAGDIAQLAYREAEDIGQVLDQAEQALFSVSQSRITRDLTPIQEVISRYYDRIEYLAAHQGEPLGIPTGFTDLDRLLGGLQQSDLVIVAARPGVGKTSLCLRFARHAARLRRHVAIFSLEMSAEQVVQRLVSAETRHRRAAAAPGEPGRRRLGRCSSQATARSVGIARSSSTTRLPFPRCNCAPRRAACTPSTAWT
jgi:replicative DNA helicase